MSNKNIFVSAGDLSGEIHASNLVRELKKIASDLRISCVGGENLKSVCDEFIDDIVNINAFGFLPIKQIFYLRKVFKKIKKLFILSPPSKVILVDYYGFNIIIAKLAKKLSIPVYYYISPQVWASRKGRIKTISKTVKKMIVILPFEEKLYRDSGVDAVFAGHPLIDVVSPKETDFNLKNPTIGLFPGSRKNAVKRHIPILIKTAEILKNKINAKFVMFGVQNSIVGKLPNFIKLDCSGDIEKRKVIDFAVCPSGTVSLENVLMGIPSAVIYKLSYFNYFVIRALIKIKHIAMANILAGKEVVPEFIQFNADPKKIAGFITEFLDEKKYKSKVEELLSFRKLLGEPGGSRRAAEIILEKL